MARTPSKIVKAIPDLEIEKVECSTKSGEKYLITENQLKVQFTLWKCIEDGFERVKTSDNPLDFDKIIPYEM